MRDARPGLHILSHRTPGTPSPSRATETPSGASCPPHFFISVKKAHGSPVAFIEISVGISIWTSRTESLYTRGSSERTKLLCVVPDKRDTRKLGNLLTFRDADFIRLGLTTRRRLRPAHDASTG